MADMFDKEELGIVSGLFGNPLQRARAEQLGAYELYSKAAGAQNPFAGLAGLSGMFATGAGQDIRGALGLQNQQERMGTVRQQAQQQFDTNTPEGLLQMAEFLNQQGDAAGARQAVMLAQGQQARTQKIATDRATEQARLREKDPEIVRIQGIRDQLEERFGPNDRRVIELNKVIEGKSKAGQTTINMPDTTGKAFEAADPEALKEYRKESRAAAGQLTLISQARQNLPTAVVGQGLPAIIRGLNTQLAPLGINTEQVASTRNLEQALKSIIAQGIKQYGANPSTVDLQFAEKAAADIQDPQKAIAATLQYLENKARTAVDKADAAEQYLLKNKNLAGFEKQWTTSTTPKGTKRTKTLSSGLVVEIED
jgi:hypothetical protein